MSIEHTVLVVTRENDPQFSMLQGLPHIVGHEPAAFASAVKDPVVILAWSGPRKLMRDVFTMCQDVRWVHSRSAGLDSLLFPELVASDVPLTNGSGVFSQSLGEFALGAILYFAKDFRRMIRNQMAGVWEQFDVEEISGADGWDCGLWRHWAGRGQAGAPHGHDRAGEQAAPAPVA